MISLDPADLDRFRGWVADRLGLSFRPEDLDRLVGVLSRRAAACHTTPDGYLRGLLAGPPAAEPGALVEELTITETYFFRHAEQLQALTEVVLPDRLRARAAQRRLRLLSVGCSSGEEAYTLAMLAMEAAPDPSWDLAVLGVDANPAMLREAETARYGSWSLRVTPPRIRDRWFNRCGSAYEVAESVRRLVRFREHNLIEDHPAVWPAAEYDVIFCRNLLMYLTPPARADLVARMTRALAPDGYLFLGHTDTLGSRPAGLQVRHSHDAFYYQRPAQRAELGAWRPRTVPAPPAGPHEHRPAVVSGPVPAPPGEGPPAHRVAWRDAVRLLRDERFAEALEQVENAPPADGAASAYRLLHAVLLALTGRQGRAVAVCRELLATDALNPDAHHLLAMCLEEDDPAAAAEHYRVAAYLDPRFALPRLRLGMLARRRGDLNAAWLGFEQALELLRAERGDRLMFFGGGFGRTALMALCRAELFGAGSRR